MSLSVSLQNCLLLGWALWENGAGFNSPLWSRSQPRLGTQRALGKRCHLHEESRSPWDFPGVSLSGWVLRLQMTPSGLGGVRSPGLGARPLVWVVMCDFQEMGRLCGERWGLTGHGPSPAQDRLAGGPGCPTPRSCVELPAEGRTLLLASVARVVLAKAGEARG